MLLLDDGLLDELDADDSLLLDVRESPPLLDDDCDEDDVLLADDSLLLVVLDDELNDDWLDDEDSDDALLADESLLLDDWLLDSLDGELVLLDVRLSPPELLLLV